MTRFFVLLAALCCACTPAVAQENRIERLQERAQVRFEGVPRKVLAFYYGWYATREVSRRWWHWDGIDTEARTLANSTNYPVTGPYDSHDPEVIERHVRQAKAAGLDGLIASWWHPGDFHDEGFPPLLAEAEKQGLSITAYFETTRSREQAAERVTELLGRYGEHPAWLKVDGKPVLFVYGRALHQIGLNEWAWVTSEVNRRLEGGAVIIGDELMRRTGRVFDGIHTYNVTGQTAGMSVDELREWGRAHYGGINAVAPGRITCATVIPGYDDEKIRSGERPTTDRHDGATYRVLWEEAIAAGPDWVLVTSFNEWHEGSEIEPSDEHGDRELKLTAELAKRFRELPPREPSTRSPGMAERQAALRESFVDRPVALMPEGDSEGMWALLATGVPVVALEWAGIIDPAVLTPDRFPALLYAGGEEYRATVRKKDDVLRAMQRYVDAGGVLVALSSGPMPFYYARGVGACEHWWQLGLPLQVAWESPPEAVSFEFHVVDREAMPHVPATFDFPTYDTRWRPLVTWGPEVEPWIALRGSDGEDYGVGAGRVPRGEGSLVYVWFRLADIEVGETLLLDLWTRIARLTKGY